MDLIGVQEIHPKFELPSAEPHYPRSAQLQIEHLELDIEIDITHRYISGVATYTISPLEGVKVRELILDACELNIKGVRASGKRLKYDHYDDKLHIQLPALDRKLKVEIEYDAHPETGMHFIVPDENRPERPIQAWTQGEDEYSRYWYPCFDSPNMKFTTEFKITVPSDMIAVSNGRLVSTQKKGNKKVFQYRERAPHSSYLNSIAVGRFSLIEDRYGKIPVQYFVPPGREEEGKRSFSKTPEMIEFFSNLIGVQYPYEKYAQVAVTEFMWGGMENISATTQTEDTLHDERAHNDFPSEPLVAHELAHQWWGDLLTTKDWSNIWLNEGFATYFEAMYREKSKGKDEFQYYMDSLSRIYFDEDSRRYRRPLVQRRYMVAGELFDRTTYQKGAWVLHMIRSILGDTLFRRAMNLYCKENMYRNVETADLIRAIEISTGRSMQEFFDQWVFSAGYPELNVRYRYRREEKEIEIVIKQIQSRADGTPCFRFDLPVSICLSGGKRLDEAIKVRNEETKFSLPLEEKPLFVSIDPENTILKKVDYERPLEDVLQQLEHGNSYERICAARELSKKSRAKAVEALSSTLRTDTFWGVQAECAEALGKINRSDALKALLSSTVKDSRARRAVVKAIGKYKDKQTVKHLASFLKDESYAVAAEAAEALGQIGGMEVVGLLKEATGIHSHLEVVKQSAFSAIAEAGDEGEIEFLREYVSPVYKWRVRAAALNAIAKLGKKDRKIREFVISQMRDPDVSYRLRTVEAVASLASAEAIPELNALIDRERDGRIKRAAFDAIKSIRQNLERPDALKELENAVEGLKGDLREMRQKIESLESRFKGFSG
ncbi:MAG: M1 family aminopeptidase [Methanomassiliicoccales archaeon]